jgi:serine/threonine-protein kinase
VKPENVLVDHVAATGKDFARLCDFGIAKVGASATTVGGPSPTGSLTGEAVIGTPYYMSPEQALGEPVDGRADIYSLGCVLFETLTGVRLFEGGTSVQIIMKHVTATPDPPSARRPGLPPELDALVLKTVAKSREQRFASAAELALALERLAASLGN